jgi:hypothetical protein
MIEPMVEITHQDYRNLVFISGFFLGAILGGMVTALAIHFKGEFE